MGLINIDKDKCKKDGLCAAECVVGLIQLVSDDAYPEMVPDGEAFCFRCGHCVAACPHGALDHEEIPLTKSPPIKKESLINEDQAVQFLRSRRSIRSYKDLPVEKEKIQRLIEIARYAPTAANAQLVEWTVFTQKDQLQRIAEMTIDWMREVVSTRKSPQAEYYAPVVQAWDAGREMILHSAPILVVASAPKFHPNGLIDVAIALTTLELAAMPLGLGTCWAGFLQFAILDSEPLKDFLALPPNHTHHYPMMLGYPSVKHYRMPERQTPKIHWR